ncbi:unnamed protein product [Durusdinium trenchii]|uniref:Cytochrome b5 heme-binding domain-containing protein n=1 Tax=Durusdinium trenchii TaxID=1381693 RepID=A0ABP0T103_9DINO
MASLPEFTKAELYEKPFPWTIIGGQVYAIGSFLHSHPGGLLIRRAIGEEATELFLSHHSPFSVAGQTLEGFKIGTLAKHQVTSVQELWSRRPLQRVFWRDLLDAQVPLLSQNFKAEVVAVLMLILFFSWCYCSYVLGCWRLNIALSWFWWRHLDAGLHAVMHGDFRTRHDIQAGLFWIYSLLSHRAMEYYYGARELKGNGMSKHWWHHIYPNDPGRDPDWSTMTGVAWVRRHTSAQWHPCHQWQCWYWLPVSMFLEPLFELIQVACALLEAVASLLEPPMNGPYVSRWAHVLGFLCEVLFNPGFQLVAFGVQPFWKALGVLLLARATSRLLLYPFSEVQHYMPEHILNREAADDSAEWVIGQLLCTANLEFRNRWAWLMDFLMFHGDSHQIEHHLWPAMSFVQYTKASQVVRATCARLRLPYYTVGYFEGYQKICEQAEAATVPR